MNWRPRAWSVLTLIVFVAQATSAARADHILPAIEMGDIAIRLQPIATGLSAPLYGINPPEDPSRLFVLEQNGLVLVKQLGSPAPPAVALDLMSRVQPPLNPGNANDERGLLGLAFHPGFSDETSPGYRSLYTYHSEPIPTGTTPTYLVPPIEGAMNNYKNVIAEWKVSATDPNVIDPLSRREIISFGKNAGNHNGGTVAFGPDGYLYLALGDGGNANDDGPGHLEPNGNAQDLTTPLGKMIRIDPLDLSLTMSSPDAASANGQYRIPASNPFDGPGEVPEMYAIGLRNPYRFSFDTATGDLILADVGQNNIEEIDRIEIGGNYGWPIKEGTFRFNRLASPGPPPVTAGSIGANTPGDPAGLIDPILGTTGYLQYDHGDGISVTGGFVYRGTAIPELVGKYVFGDLALRNEPPRVDGRLFYADLETGEIKEFMLPQFSTGILPDGLTVHGFGQDANGELYAMVTNTPSNGDGGIVYKLVPIPEPSAAMLLVAALVCGVCRQRRR